MIFGDFNAHHSMWGSTVANTVGKQIHHFIDLLILMLLNTSKNTGVGFSVMEYGWRRGSLLDLTIAFNDLADRAETTVTDSGGASYWASRALPDI